MLAIRYQRFGKKKQPTFRVVVTPKTSSTKSGKFIEILGFRDPRAHEQTLNKERILYWLSQGAQPSDTVHNLFVSEGIIDGSKKDVSSKKNVGKAAPNVATEAKEDEGEVAEASADDTAKPVATDVDTVEEKKEEVVAEEVKDDAGEEKPTESEEKDTPEEEPVKEEAKQAESEKTEEEKTKEEPKEKEKK